MSELVRIWDEILENHSVEPLNLADIVCFTVKEFENLLKALSRSAVDPEARLSSELSSRPWESDGGLQLSATRNIAEVKELIVSQQFSDLKKISDRGERLVIFLES